MGEILTVKELTKTFKLSSKQQKLEKTGAKVKTAVDRLSFSVNEGEIFGLLGPNGAGKTTTLGHDIVREPDAVRRSVGFLTGELKLEDYFTPNYLFDFFSELHGVPTQVRDARKKELFDRFGIGEFAEVKVGNLSTGMKQKASIVISIVHDPAIIIFDEPTNGLDVLTAKVVTDFLAALKEQGKTVIVSTHIFSLIEKVCDRVGVIVDGKMAVCGTLADVCGEKTLEDSFFDIYAERMGERV